MKNQISKKYCIFLSFIAIISLVSIWCYCQITIKEINMLTSNISGIISQKDDVIDKDKKDSTESDNLEEEEEESVCYAPVLTMASAGYYYSPQGDQLGVGPLPPMVDVQTNYWIFWEVLYNDKDLNNFEISAQLPERVIWTGKKTALAGSVQYGEASRRVIWKIDQINKDNKNYKIGFEIGLIPTDQDVNNILNLLNNIEYQAIDKSCQKEIKGKLNNITTDLIFDNLAKDKGVVVSLE